MCIVNIFGKISRFPEFLKWVYQLTEGQPLPDADMPPAFQQYVRARLAGLLQKVRLPGDVNHNLPHRCVAW